MFHPEHVVLRKGMETRDGGVAAERNFDRGSEPTNAKIGPRDGRRENERGFRNGHLPGDHLHLSVGETFRLQDNPCRVSGEGSLREGVHLLYTDFHLIFLIYFPGSRTAVSVFFSRTKYNVPECTRNEPSAGVETAGSSVTRIATVPDGRSTTSIT